MDKGKGKRDPSRDQSPSTQSLTIESYPEVGSSPTARLCQDRIPQSFVSRLWASASDLAHDALSSGSSPWASDLQNSLPSAEGNKESHLYFKSGLSDTSRSIAKTIGREPLAESFRTVARVHASSSDLGTSSAGAECLDDSSRATVYSGVTLSPPPEGYNDKLTGVPVGASNEHYNPDISVTKLATFPSYWETIANRLFHSYRSEVESDTTTINLSATSKLDWKRDFQQYVHSRQCYFSVDDWLSGKLKTAQPLLAQTNTHAKTGAWLFHEWRSEKETLILDGSLDEHSDFDWRDDFRLFSNQRLRGFDTDAWLAGYPIHTATLSREQQIIEAKVPQEDPNKSEREPSVNGGWQSAEAAWESAATTTINKRLPQHLSDIEAAQHKDGSEVAALLEDPDTNVLFSDCATEAEVYADTEASATDLFGTATMDLVEPDASFDAAWSAATAPTSHRLESTKSKAAIVPSNLSLLPGLAEPPSHSSPRNSLHSLHPKNLELLHLPNLPDVLTNLLPAIESSSSSSGTGTPAYYLSSASKRAEWAEQWDEDWSNVLERYFPEVWAPDDIPRVECRADHPEGSKAGDEANQSIWDESEAISLRRLRMVMKHVERTRLQEAARMQAAKRS